jgi:hypothetical protein
VESQVFKINKAEEVHANVVVVPKPKKMEETTNYYDSTPQSFVDQTDAAPIQQSTATYTGTAIYYIAWL